jgi:hypothetical protein
LVALLVALGVLWSASAPFAGRAADGPRASHPECAALARSVAGRSHSILDSARYRATERQAYGVCLSDPPAFRRIVRGY